MIAKFSLDSVCPITVHLDSLMECIHVFTNTCSFLSNAF